MTTFYCPTKGDFCDDPKCDEALDKFDNGITQNADMPCGENWLDLQIRCDECDMLTKLREISFRICRKCRTLEDDDATI